MKVTKIIIGSDHTGVNLKQEIKKVLLQQNVVFEDVGVEDSNEASDYPNIAKKVTKLITADKTNQTKGILICGTGTGMSIAANRVKGIRAAIAYDTYSAKMARADNDANVLCLRARYFPFDKSKEFVKTWLQTPFSKLKRHKQRIEQLDKR